MATKNARDAAPDVAQPDSQRNRAALVEARRMTPGETSQTRRDGLAQEMAKFDDLAGIGELFDRRYLHAHWVVSNIETGLEQGAPTLRPTVGPTLETDTKKFFDGLHTPRLMYTCGRGSLSRPQDQRSVGRAHIPARRRGVVRRRHAGKNIDNNSEVALSFGNLA